MGKNKPITKCCPDCGFNVAIACKTCPGCKHSFYNTKGNSGGEGDASSKTQQPDVRRRTRPERVKRVKPNYYDASEFERKPPPNPKKRRLERHSSGGDSTSGRERTRVSAPPPPPPPVASISANSLNKKKKKTKKKMPKQAKIEEEDDEPPPVLTLDKIRQCSIVLSELNRKMISTSWKVL